MNGRHPDDHDAMYDLLADERRRIVISRVLTDESVSVEDLSGTIAAHERGVTRGAIDRDDRQPITVSLVHNHLPRLDDRGIVAYDHEEKTVEPGPEIDAIEPLIERIETDVETERSSSLFPAY